MQAHHWLAARANDVSGSSSSVKRDFVGNDAYSATLTEHYYVSTYEEAIEWDAKANFPYATERLFPRCGVDSFPRCKQHRVVLHHNRDCESCMINVRLSQLEAKMEALLNAHTIQH
jgi:hypothetical protein